LKQETELAEQETVLGKSNIGLKEQDAVLQKLLFLLHNNEK
jgi:hypothetical protein